MRQSVPRWNAFFALAIFILSGSVAAAPQQARENDDTDSQRFLALLQKWNKDPDTFPAYLEADAIERKAGTSHVDVRQILAPMASELGLYDTAIKEWPLGAASTGSKLAALPSADAVPADAAETIARLAQDRRIVIVNEAHHAAQTRALFLDLLPRLRKSGFNWYCAETLEASDLPRLRQQGYPIRTSGTYSKEPVFGEVLRRAVGLGYSICAYESDNEDQQARETEQAMNIARLLREHPDARVLIHAGYGHARKDITVDNARPMAAELKRLTGIDPLTVDQTTLGAIVPRDRENPAYRLLLPRLPGVTHAGVFVEANGKPWSLEPAAYDASVILPDPPPAHGRAGWLWTIPGKVAVAGFDADCQTQYPCAIEARHAGESDDAVPADVVVRQSRDNAVPALALFPGKYRIRIVAPDGTRLRETSLTVGTSGQ